MCISFYDARLYFLKNEFHNILHFTQYETFVIRHGYLFLNFITQDFFWWHNNTRGDCSSFRVTFKLFKWNLLNEFAKN